MLILTRKMGESVFIGENVKVTILSNRGGQIRIGFEAPDDVQILREEVRARNELEEGGNHV